MADVCVRAKRRCPSTIFRYPSRAGTDGIGPRPHLLFLGIMIPRGLTVAGALRHKSAPPTYGEFLVGAFIRGLRRLMISRYDADIHSRTID